MSSCFLCDTSTKLGVDDGYNVMFPDRMQKCYMKFMPIMVGSTGTLRNDQQHLNQKDQNYVSYRVKKIEFRSSVYEKQEISVYSNKPCFILIFKVPFRNPVFDYYFTIMDNFMLYSEPESVLKYSICGFRHITLDGAPPQRAHSPERYDLIIDKPFIVGPNDYVGVLYMFVGQCDISSSAKVWFDVV